MNTSDNFSNDFTSVLMSFIHDIKNSLVLSLNSLEQLYNTLAKDDFRNQQTLAQLQYEFRRINNSLIQLLSLYKMETRIFTVQCQKNNINNLLQKQIQHNVPMETIKDIAIELSCDQDLEWVFDKELIAGVISSVINNSIRYTQSKISINARIEDDYLTISIEDDGPGFPENMFNNFENIETAIKFDIGCTGLGLYFAEKIAELHQRNDKTGVISLDNKSDLGGGRFTIKLP